MRNWTHGRDAWQVHPVQAQRYLVDPAAHCASGRSAGAAQTRKRRKPLISVVIPSFESDGTICSTLDSVLAQTLPADEIVVVDDASRTPVRDVLAGRYPDVRVIRHAANSGVQVARNTGFAATTGDYVLFLDSDDLLCPEFLTTVTGLLGRFPEKAACFCSFYRVRQGEISSTVATHQPREPEFFEMPRGEGLSFYLEHNGALIPSFTMFRRTALNDLCRQTDLFFSHEKLSPNEDFHLFSRLLAKNEVLFIDNPMGLYFLRPQSLSGNHINVWSSRGVAIASLLTLGNDAPFTEPHRAMLYRMWGAADRKHARLLARAGRQREAKQVLWRSLAREENLKTLLLLLIIWLRRVGRNPAVVVPSRTSVLSPNR